MQNKLRTVLFIGVLTVTSGCSLLWDTSSSSDQAEVALGTNSPKPEAPVNRQGVEIEWGVPLKPVESYLIRYGRSPNNLNQEIRVPVSQLDKIDHAAYGPVYRYYLEGTKPTEELYVSLRAQNILGVSEASAPIKVDPIAPESSK